MKAWRRLSAIASLVFCSWAPLAFGTDAPSASGYVELHAHPFMKQGMGLMFRGDFNDELKATSYKDRFSSQINPRTLDESKIGALVVSLYAHPFMNVSTKQSIREQLRLTHEFVKKHSDRWEIARNPAQARGAAALGKKLVFIALEGAAGVIETDEDLKEFVDDGLVRIVTILHLTDDHLGGVAFLKGIRGIFSPFAWLAQMFDPHRDSAGVRINRNGLSESGLELTKKLMARRVWIDLSHASDEAVKELIPMVSEGGRPLLFTHTILRKYFGAERAMPQWQIDEVKRTRGVVGLMPSEEMLAGVPENNRFCPSTCRSGCSAGIFALAQQYAELKEAVGQGSVFFGSDFNGGIPHLKTPDTCATNTEFDRHGLWHIGQTPLAWGALKSLGAVKEDPFKESVPQFLGAWSRLYGVDGN